MTRTVHRQCTLCEAACGLSFEVEGERVLRVRGDQDDPFSRGFVCAKGVAAGELHHDPDRLRAPLVRGADGELHEATWEEAFDAAASGLAAVVERHGLHALGSYTGNPVVHNVGAMFGTEIFRALLPSRNRYTANSQDANPHLLANRLMYGLQLSHAVPDLSRTRHLLIVGANPVVSGGSLMTAPGVGRRLRGIQERGGKVVVIDPRRTETAQLADEHLFVTPGGDAHLLLALAREIATSGRWDTAFLERWCSGWEQLPQLLAPFTPEAVAPRVGPGLDPATIRRLADELAQAPCAAVYSRLGVCSQPFAGLTAWAVNLLNLITGNVDRPGGAMFPDSPSSWMFAERFARGSYDRYRSPQGVPEISAEYPCHILADQIERGRGDPQAAEALHGLVTFSGNPVHSVPNGPRLEKALRSLEFMVSVDIYLSETARLADVVLPPRSSLCDPHYDPIFSHLAVEEIARWSPPVVPAPAGQPNELELISRLALGIARRAPRLGLARRLAGKLEPLVSKLTVERVVGWLIRFGPHGRGLNPLSSGLTLRRLATYAHGMPTRPLQPRLADRVRQRDGKVHLVPEPYARDLPRLREALAEPVHDGLLLIGRRHRKTNNSWFHNLPRMLKGNACRLWIHPEDAAERGLQTGDAAELSTAIGSLQVEVELCDDLARGVISLPHGWGHAGHGGQTASASSGVNVNHVIDDRRIDPLTGNAAFNGVPVQLSPVKALVS